jgi:FkbM family methyltransferase
MTSYSSQFSARCALLARILAAFIDGFALAGRPGLIRGICTFLWCLANWTVRPRQQQFTTTSPSGDRITLRAKSSDFLVYAQVLLGRGYDVTGIEPGGEIFRRYEAITFADKVPVIVDGGANIGLAALYFARKFPSALILLIEPDRANMAIAKLNTAGLQNVRYYECGLWSNSSTLVCVNPDSTSWSFQFREALAEENRAGIPAKSIDDILADLPPGSCPFIIKLDVEGAEGHILSARSNWLASRPIIMIEPHDYEKPGCHLLSGLLKNPDYHESDLILISDMICFVPRLSPKTLNTVPP